MLQYAFTREDPAHGMTAKQASTAHGVCQIRHAGRQQDICTQLRPDPNKHAFLMTRSAVTITTVTMMIVITRGHYLLLKQDLQYVYSILMPADLMLQSTIVGFEQLCSCQQV